MGWNGSFHTWGTPKWMNYNGKSYENGWFRGTPILGNLQVTPATCGVFYHFNTSMMFSEAVTTVKCCLGIAVGIRLGTWKLQQKKGLRINQKRPQSQQSWSNKMVHTVDVCEIKKTSKGSLKHVEPLKIIGCLPFLNWCRFFSHSMLTNRFELLHA